MIIINTPLKADEFKAKAEEKGLTFEKKVGIKMSFRAPEGADEAALAAELKKFFKADKSLNMIAFNVVTG